MKDPLREIFELCELNVGYHPMTSEEQAVWDKAQEVLGKRAMAEMLYAQCRSLAEEQYDCFRAGFRLGAQLMLELR